MRRIAVNIKEFKGNKKEFLLLLLLGIGIHFLFPWKFYITQDGIYLRRLDLFVPWSDISGVSHVWINKASNFSSGINSYNNKDFSLALVENYRVGTYSS